MAMSDTSMGQADHLLSEMADQLGHLVLIWDGRGTLTYSSKTGHDLFGLAPGASFEAFLQRVRGNDRRDTAACWERAREGTTPCGCEHRLVAPGGEEHRVQWAVLPTRDSQGQVVGLRAVGFDLTRTYRIWDQARHSEHSEGMIRLVRGLAHDLNNMLVSVLGNASVLARQLPENHPWRPIVDDIEKGADRAAGLIQQLLVYARSLNPTFRRVRLRDVLADHADQIRGSLPATVRLDIRQEAADDHVQADPVQLRQVVLNLLHNAAESMPEGGTVQVRTANMPWPSSETHPAATTAVALIIEDEGTGITPEVYRQMFEPYFSTKGSGRGLGLAVVQGVVHSHRGCIQVAPASKRGTVVRVFLPLSD